MRFFLVVIITVFGLYLALWQCFALGISQIVTSVTSDPVSAYGIVFGCLRAFVLPTLVGWLILIVDMLVIDEGGH